MIKLNRTTEYGLMALRYMANKSPSVGVTSAREIADRYGLPFEITAKTLQRLKEYDLIHSAQGARGGYTLKRDLNSVSLGEFVQLMEGAQGVVGCVSSHANVQSSACEYDAKCELKVLLGGLNSRVQKFLSEIPLSELLNGRESLGNQPASATSLALSRTQDEVSTVF